MSGLEVHIEKYKMFRGDAENESVSFPTRIECYFSAAFHLIDACMAAHGLHINKHQRVRHELESHMEVFEEDTEKIWREFQKIENQIRPGQLYGGRINGEELKRARKSFREIEEVCLKLLRL